MAISKPRYYKFFPQTEIDLGTMPFEGDFTTNDIIVKVNEQGFQIIYIYNSNTHEFGRYVTKKVGKRVVQVWEPGVKVGPVTIIDPTTQEEVQAPVWFMYYGDGVCAVKVPNGEVVEVQP